MKTRVGQEAFKKVSCKLFCLSSALVAAGMLLAGPDCGAAGYDGAADFSLNSNPNGVWSYGYSATLGGTMTLDLEKTQDISGLYIWRKSGSAANGPSFAFNPTGNTITITQPTGLMIWNPGQLSLHPGSVNLEYCVLRFTAPASGEFQVTGAYSSVDKYYGATTDVHILKNGTSIFDGTVMGKQSVSSFDQTVELNAGDVLDFAVGPYQYGGGWDSTGLAATITLANHPPVADATATQPRVIACNSSNAAVILNGSKSYDPDGDPLQYFWYVNGAANPSATGKVAVVVLPVGTNSIRLMVSDGQASGNQTIHVRVLTSQQAVEDLILEVVRDVPRYQPLVATLAAAHDAIDRGGYTPAINQLHAFQLKVRAQVAPMDSALAKMLTRTAQQIIDAVDCARSGGE